MLGVDPLHEHLLFVGEVHGGDGVTDRSDLLLRGLRHWFLRHLLARILRIAVEAALALVVRHQVHILHGGGRLALHVARAVVEGVVGGRVRPSQEAVRLALQSLEQRRVLLEVEFPVEDLLEQEVELEAEALTARFDFAVDEFLDLDGQAVEGASGPPGLNHLLEVVSVALVLIDGIVDVLAESVGTIGPLDHQGCVTRSH